MAKRHENHEKDIQIAHLKNKERIPSIPIVQMDLVLKRFPRRRQESNRCESNLMSSKVSFTTIYLRMSKHRYFTLLRHKFDIIHHCRNIQATHFGVRELPKLLKRKTHKHTDFHSIFINRDFKLPVGFDNTHLVCKKAL